MPEEKERAGLGTLIAVLVMGAVLVRRSWARHAMLAAASAKHDWLGMTVAMLSMVFSIVSRFIREDEDGDQLGTWPIWLVLAVIAGGLLLWIWMPFRP